MRFVMWLLLMLVVGVVAGFVLKLVWPHAAVPSSRSSIHALRPTRT